MGPQRCAGTSGLLYAEDKKFMWTVGVREGFLEERPLFGEAGSLHSRDSGKCACLETGFVWGWLSVLTSVYCCVGVM